MNPSTCCFFLLLARYVGRNWHQTRESRVGGGQSNLTGVMAQRLVLDIEAPLPLCHQGKTFVNRDNLLFSKVYCVDDVLDRIDYILSVR